VRAHDRSGVFALITSFDDPTVTAVGALMVLLAAVAVVAIERAVGVARLFGTESKR
jgi:hypothetical protein